MANELVPSNAIKFDLLLRLLRNQYGQPPLNTPRPPTDELVMTILSQHTSDSNTAHAFASLRERFPSWDDIANAPLDDVIDAIRVGGLANVKAPVIQAALRSIADRNGDYDLEFLSTMTNQEVFDWLTSLHGVGPKTAACVLLFSLGRPVMPVDTHVHRVANRLGILAEGTSAATAHRLIERYCPAESMYDAHMLLIQHGRATCRARYPRCQRCILELHCPSARRFDSPG